MDIFAMWMVEARQFSLHKTTNGALLTVSDGRELDLAKIEWLMLVQALAEFGAPLSSEIAGSKRERTGLPRNNGEKWTAKLDRQLKSRWEEGASADELAREFERTKGAITSRLVLLGLMVHEAALKLKDA
ncbi:hypothetical protein [Bradyrhizobium sp. B117]|uniref:hypothetical protein n=1 Tax=Bradyrhizobium sp. B117 TaxID=3140246 RepID=UPI0031842BEA